MTNDRFDDELRSQLRGRLDAVPVAVPGEDAVRQRAARQSRTQRRRVAGGGMALIVAATVGVVVWNAGRSDHEKVETVPAATASTATALPATTSPATTLPATATTASPSSAVPGSTQASGSTASITVVTSPSSVASPTAPSPTATTAKRPPLEAIVPLSATYVSARTGFVLGRTRCSDPAGVCPARVRKTTDGGSTWVSVGAPPVSAGEQGSTGLFELRFADANTGFALGRELWVTRDGAATWTKADLPSPGDETGALEIMSHVVYVTHWSGGTTFDVYASPVDHLAWQKQQGGSVDVGAGPVPQTQLVLRAGRGWMLNVNRQVIGGTRLVNGAWQAWTPPCGDGPEVLDASTNTNVVVVCTEGVWSGPTITTKVLVSSDGGVTFTPTATQPSFTEGAVNGPVASPSPGVILVVAGGHLVRSTDDGVTWRTVSHGCTCNQFGFTSPTQGFGFTATAMYRTLDGGASWSVVDLTRQP